MSRRVENGSGLKLALFASLAIHLLVLLVVDVNEFDRQPPTSLVISFEPIEAQAQITEPSKPRKKPIQPPKVEKRSEPRPLEEESFLPAEEAEKVEVPRTFTAEEKRAQETYLRKIRRKILRAKAYPREARRNGLQGTTKLMFVIGKNGQILEAHVSESSKHEILDQAALDAILRAAPFKQPPAPLLAAKVQLSLPIVFQLR